MSIRRLSLALVTALTLLCATRFAYAQCATPRCSWANFDHFDDEANAIMKWGYNIDGFDPNFQQIELFVDNSGHLVSTFHSREIQTYVFPEACTTQTHTLGVYIWLANFYAEAQTPFPPPARPSVSASLTTNQSGQTIVHVTY